MAIYTPRGLKIRLSVDYAFTLMARLYPKVNAFKVLKLTEGLESLHSLITCSLGFLCFYLKLSLIEIGIIIFIASIISSLITIKGFFIPGFIQLGTLYSYISGFAILPISMIIFGYINNGWQSVIVFYVSIFVARYFRDIMKQMQLKKIYSKIDLILTVSEIIFFNAYIYYAKKLNKTIDITVSADEITKNEWMIPYEDLALNWPKIVNRFDNR